MSATVLQPGIYDFEVVERPGYEVKEIRIESAVMGLSPLSPLAPNRAVTTNDGLDIKRYICSAWFEPFWLNSSPDPYRSRLRFPWAAQGADPLKDSEQPQ